MDRAFNCQGKPIASSFTNTNKITERLASRHSFLLQLTTDTTRNDNRLSINKKYVIPTYNP